jgi:hypothetical protein
MMMAAWEHPTYNDYAKTNASKGLQVIPKALWIMLKEDAQLADRVWTMADL